MASGLSEQPSFYDELCTDAEEDRCYDKDIAVQALDRSQFRHGAVINDKDHVPEMAFHPNWMVGIDMKLDTLRRKGMYLLAADWKHCSIRR